MNNFNNNTAEKIRENSIYVDSIEDIPEILLDDGAIIVNNSDSISLCTIEGKIEKNLPIIICWKEVLAENADKVPGKFSVWSKATPQIQLKSKPNIFYTFLFFLILPVIMIKVFINQKREK